MAGEGKGNPLQPSCLENPMDRGAWQATRVASLGRKGRTRLSDQTTTTTTLMAESQEELKSLLMMVKEESEKPGLKLNIKKIKIMAFGSIT